MHVLTLPSCPPPPRLLPCRYTSFSAAQQAGHSSHAPSISGSDAALALTDAMHVPPSPTCCLSGTPLSLRPSRLVCPRWPTRWRTLWASSSASTTQPWVRCVASQCPSLPDPLEGPPWAVAVLAALLLLHLQLVACWEALTALPWHPLVREGLEGGG